MTQIEDVPAQIAAEALRQKKKVYEALERRSRALLEEERLAKASVRVQSDVSGTPTARKKKVRVAVRKLKKGESEASRRSPRVNPSPGSGVDGKRHSPRLKAPVEAPVEVKKTKPAAKVKKSVGAGNGKKTVISAKKTSPAAKKSVRFEKDDDFVPVFDKEPDEEEDVAADDEGGDDSDFDSDVSKVIFRFLLYTIFAFVKLYFS